ncbi:hypothetical protein LFDSGCCC_CDS0027 [Phage C75C1]|nr:hypothetical protein LFDSGCCC_CDS0027 [Phage C75C1]
MFISVFNSSSALMGLFCLFDGTLLYHLYQTITKH